MAKHSIVNQLLAAIDDYCVRYNMTRTAFGREAAGDGHFITRLERGTQPRLDTIDRVYRYINRKRKHTA